MTILLASALLRDSVTLRDYVTFARFRRPGAQGRLWTTVVHHQDVLDQPSGSRDVPGPAQWQQGRPWTTVVHLQDVLDHRGAPTGRPGPAWVAQGRSWTSLGSTGTSLDHRGVPRLYYPAQCTQASLHHPVLPCPVYPLPTVHVKVRYTGRVSPRQGSPL